MKLLRRCLLFLVVLVTLPFVKAPPMGPNPCDSDGMDELLKDVNKLPPKPAPNK